ncbi:Toluene-4-sulfonate monooxygenase system iron-sulfur subunit TsaM1 [Paraburkholderia domus]|uniref:aromatic ring-hydroxylating dioxygenase subunit alpha n=1 Tax=Paraburkholderia domus TaxID=2793075 RepID=UPI0019115736|nr:aromatic ring-hydroxylating dioxygenase subunit alpha [Paraburkholderia domus]MBK5089958.1 Rieske 2Fe-2S domain-containing protein [Burkholderia sp. R-69927]CAE6911191.1 Toluene-4-sulfonate monooxygenase system iron-sulfur subunit TsaM1 [Paraburkholderia domus]
MFVKNAWYCAGWDYEFTQSKDSLVTRKIANERVVLYRRLDGVLVAFEDRCPHRQAALSLGRKEGDSLRCMYHGMRFGPDGTCNEIPGQSRIPDRACVRAFPVIEKDNWVWVWMGDPVKADPALIPFAVGPSEPEWNIKTSKMHVKTNYRNEIANLSDLSHITWIHENTVGGSRKYTEVSPEFELIPRGMKTRYWVRSCAAPGAARHLFAPDALFDIHFDICHTIPCTWILHYRLFTAGTATEGESNGQLILDTWSSQAVTPRDEDSVDYYFSWGASRATDFPGGSDMLKEAVVIAFQEDAVQLEAQHIRQKEKPDFQQIDIPLDAGPGKMLWVLDRLLRQEATEQISLSQ